jgi:hypothetical protein
VENGNEKNSPSGSTASPHSGNENIKSDENVREYGTLRWIWVCFAIYSTSFIYGLDNAIVADIQGPLIDDLGEVGKLGWLAIGFPLGSVATILTL